MLTANNIKFIKSINAKKFRKEFNLFVAEGHKLVSDILNSDFEIDSIYHLNSWLVKPNTNISNYVSVSPKEMERISSLKTPPEVIALVKIPTFNFDLFDCKEQLFLALDGVQDPGNLGTIIRLADWFGIQTIFCSHDTADAFSPKVVQATMGAITRVNAIYTDLNGIIKEGNKLGIPTFGTFLSGENIYSVNLPKNGIIVLGNEGKGISKQVEDIIPTRLCIPNFSTSSSTSESLNVATAGAIICSEFRRRI